MPGRSRKQNSWLCNQLEFYFDSAELPVLPSADELKENAAALLRALDAPQLAAQLRIEWNTRMRSAVGRAQYEHCLIWLNPVLQKFGWAEVDRTIRHELAHLLARFRCGRRRIAPHGAEWRQACQDLGIMGERACHRLPIAIRHIPRRFLYRCMQCGREFPRVHAVRQPTACLICCRQFAGGNYDERFRLRLVRGVRTHRFLRDFRKCPQ